MSGLFCACPFPKPRQIVEVFFRPPWASTLDYTMRKQHKLLKWGRLVINALRLIIEVLHLIKDL